MPHLSRRRFLFGLAALPCGFAGCRSGPLTALGYRLGADALYDPNIKTVNVRMFNNRAFQTTPYRGLEVAITEAVVNEIGRTTPFRVESDPDKADTELIGNIVSIQKAVTLRNQQNTVREGELQVTIDVVWRDLRDGTILSATRKPRPPGSGPALAEQSLPFDPTLPPPPPVTEVQGVVPARIVAYGRYLTELGETNTSAAKRIQNQAAVQIVSMMERKWCVGGGGT